MTEQAAAPERSGAAVLGSPIAHSLSPALHLAAYDALGLRHWSYRAIECGESDLLNVLRALDDEGLVGASLTMPLKRAVLPMLAEVDAEARLVGAVNTVMFDPGGWRGVNTDVPGLYAALRSQVAQLPERATAAILGAGATAASAIAALGNFDLKGVEIFARRPASADPLTRLAPSVELDVSVRSWDELDRAMVAPIVISTTPAGATGDVGPDPRDAVGVLFDVVYAPWPTPLAKVWAAAGGQVVSGLELLIEQAAVQVELMTRREAPIDAMRKAVS